MRKYLVGTALALSLALSGATFAQDAQSATADQQSNATATAKSSQRGERMFNQLSQKLNLTDEQKQQLKPIFAERRKQMQELRASTADKSDKHKQAKQIMQDTDAKIKTVLTADQFKQYEQLKQQMREQRKERRDSEKQQQQQQPQQ